MIHNSERGKVNPVAQLIMTWNNDGTPARSPVLPADVSVQTLAATEDGVGQWLEIVQYMGQEPTLRDRAFYDRVMTARPLYDPSDCLLLTVAGEAAATVTVICDMEKKEGYIHMVACKPAFRGRGLGHLLNDLALCDLKTRGMQSAWLTTDDWRIPAIRTYLKAGFRPDTHSQPDFADRWQNILAVIHADR